MTNSNPNIDNLQPVKSKEEATKRGKNGGIASGVAKREKKLLTGALKELLKEGETVQGINTALLEKAMSGDTKAYEVIRDSIGEKPTDKQQITGVLGLNEASDEAFSDMMEKANKW